LRNYRSRFWKAERRKSSDDFDGFEAHGNNLADQAKNVSRIMGAVRVVGDAAAFVG
jgi:hypothetical protein